MLLGNKLLYTRMRFAYVKDLTFPSSPGHLFEPCIFRLRTQLKSFGIKTPKATFPPTRRTPEANHLLSNHRSHPRKHNPHICCPQFYRHLHNSPPPNTPSPNCFQGATSYLHENEILCGASLVAPGSLPFEGEAATEVSRKGSLRFGRSPAAAT